MFTQKLALSLLSVLALTLFTYESIGVYDVEWRSAFIFNILHHNPWFTSNIFTSNLLVLHVHEASSVIFPRQLCCESMNRILFTLFFCSAIQFHVISRLDCCFCRFILLSFSLFTCHFPCDALRMKTKIENKELQSSDISSSERIGNVCYQAFN